MQTIKLWTIVNIKTWKLDANARVDWWQYPFFTCSRKISKIDTFTYDCECVLIAWNWDLNVKYYNWKFDAYQRTYIIEDNKKEKLYIKYLYYFMQSYIEILRDQTIGWVIQYIKLWNLTDIDFPFLPLQSQKQIIQKLDKLTNLIELRKQSIQKTEDLTKSIFIEMFGDISINSKSFNVMNFWEILEIKAKMVDPKKTEYKSMICIWWANIESETWNLIKIQTAEEQGAISNKFLVSKKEILFSKIRPKLKKVSFPWIKCLCSADIYPFSLNTKLVNQNYILVYLLSDLFTAIVTEFAEKRSQIPKVNRKELESILIPVPPITLQNIFATIVQKNEENIRKQKESLLKLEELYSASMQESFSF